MTDQKTTLDRLLEKYDVTIGIEVHVQLNTQSKIFCSCSTAITKEPNSNICQICCGHPGTLPVLNKKVVDCGIMAALATNSTIPEVCTFDRKHYVYPDLPKNYQITQQAHPICVEGHIPIRLKDGTIKKVNLIRIHMEEDAGKNIHASDQESLVDLNRAGTPLLEVVTYPDISSSFEARAYLKALHGIVTYLGICSGNMEEGAFRADANVSVKLKGAHALGTKCELKNINSFKFISDAIDYEIERQMTQLEQGVRIRSETRLWDTKNKKTMVMRSKEERADYRFLPDPDLPDIHIDTAWIDRIRNTMPELPEQLLVRLCTTGLTPYEAEILLEDKELVRYYEQAHALNTSKHIINWILRDVIGYLKEHKIAPQDFLVTPQKLAQLITLLEQGTINARAAREVFDVIAVHGGEPTAIVQERGLAQIGSADEMETIVKEIIAANPANVAAYKAGKDKLIGFFVGQAMQKTKGNGNPAVIQELFKKYLAS